MDVTYSAYLDSVLKLVSSRYDLELDGLTPREKVNLVGNYIELEDYVSGITFKGIDSDLMYGEIEEEEEQEAQIIGVSSITVGGE